MNTSNKLEYEGNIMNTVTKRQFIICRAMVELDILSAFVFKRLTMHNVKDHHENDQLYMLRYNKLVMALDECRSLIKNDEISKALELMEPLPILAEELVSMFPRRKPI